ncbi:MAG: precorrin-6A reductase [Peptococcaceae bacterium]|nr:precorrin-6A reductase [Peptococcaceae bacterium]
MILVIGGTSDGREIAQQLEKHGCKVLVSTATDYGYNIAKSCGLNAVQGRLNRQGLVSLIENYSIRLVVDASHPYAEEITENTTYACRKKEIAYIRYSRPKGKSIDNPLVVEVESYQQAVEKASNLGDSIFLTIGSKNSGLFIESLGPKNKRLILRITPDPVIIADLLNMGVAPADLIAIQGPFSESINIAMLNHFKADVLVTKESGREGGFQEKISAAIKLGIPVIVIKRPPEPPGATGSIKETIEKALVLLKINILEIEE